MSPITNNLKEKLDITNLPNPLLFDENLVTRTFMEMLPLPTQLSFFRAIGKSSLKGEDFPQDQKIWDKRIECCSTKYDETAARIMKLPEVIQFEYIYESGDHVLLDTYLNERTPQENYKNEISIRKKFPAFKYLAGSEYLESFAVLTNSNRFIVKNFNLLPDLMRYASAKIFSFFMKTTVDISVNDLAMILSSDLKPILETKKIIDELFSSPQAREWAKENLYFAALQALTQCENPYLAKYLFKKVDKMIDLFSPFMEKFFVKNPLNLNSVLGNAIQYECFDLAKVLIGLPQFSEDITPEDRHTLQNICIFEEQDDLARQLMPDLKLNNSSMINIDEISMDDLDDILFSDERPLFETKMIIDELISSSRTDLYPMLLQALIISENHIIEKYMYRKIDKMIDSFSPFIAEFFEQKNVGLLVVLENAIGYECFELVKVLIELADLSKMAPDELDWIEDICRLSGQDDLAKQIDNKRYQG